jgi:LPXTG-motif cell wall-anchored protein
MDYVRGDMLSLMLWLGIAILVLGAVYVVMRINRNK